MKKKTEASEKEGVFERMNIILTERFPPPGELELYACLVALAIALVFYGDTLDLSQFADWRAYAMVSIPSFFILYYAFSDKIPGKFAGETLRFIFSYAIFVASIMVCVEVVGGGQFTDILSLFAALLVVLGILRATWAIIEYDKAGGKRFVYKNISVKSLIIATFVFIIVAIAGKYFGLTMAMAYLTMLNITQILPREFKA